MPGRVLVNAALTAAEPDVVKLRVGRSLLLHAKADVYRTAIVDPSICEIVKYARASCHVARTTARPRSPSGSMTRADSRGAT